MGPRYAKASACLFSFVVSFLLISTSALAEEPNETFAETTVLDSGVLSITDSLTPGETTGFPDTYLGAFDSFEFLVAEDDDGSSLGDGFASGLTNVPINADGTIDFSITGVGDFFFEGDHNESGAYEAHVDVLDSAREILNSFIVSGTLQDGIVDQYSFSGYSFADAYDINIDNAIGVSGGDVDFFTFTGLTPGSMFAAETSSVGTIDTVLGWFDDAGSLLEIDDDSGQGDWSRLEGTVPLSGQLTFAVSGDGDELFGGSHTQLEVYSLQLTIDGVELPGDFEGDGDVDLFDLTHPTLGWEARYGTNLSGTDFLTWQQAFGSSSLAAAQSVPEPAAAVIGILACLVLPMRRPVR